MTRYLEPKGWVADEDMGGGILMGGGVHIISSTVILRSTSI